LIAPETGKPHYAGLLSVSATSNLTKHFCSHHPNFFSLMETQVKGNNEADAGKALATFLEAHQPGSANKSL
jgi:hypothetical protein